MAEGEPIECGEQPANICGYRNDNPATERGPGFPIIFPEKPYCALHTVAFQKMIERNAPAGGTLSVVPI
jgi:hypothetical protein